MNAAEWSATVAHRLVLDPIALRKQRLARGWSQRDLADAAKVRPATVSDAENGTRPYPSTIRKFAAALDVRPTDIARIVEVP